MRRLAFLLSLLFCFAGISFAAPQPGGHAITIQVNDAATGDPIPQADVSADRDRTTTDDFGQCAMTLPDRGQYLSVRVSKKGYVDMAAQWRNLKPGEKLPSQLTFNMAPGTAIGGKVVDENGQPVNGAVVHLISGGDGRATDGAVRSEMNIDAHTDANGMWSSDSAPAPADLKHAYYRVTASGYYSLPYYTNVQSVDQLRDRSVVFTISHAAHLSGTVLDQSGKPVENAAVTAGEQGMGGVLHSSTTDAAGHFALDNLHPGSVNFAIFTNQFAPQIVSVTAPATQPTIVHLQPGKTMKFHVVDKSGQPLTGVKIEVSQWNDVQYMDYSLHTDAQGDAVWAGAPDNAIAMTLTKRHFGSIVDKPFKATGNPINITLGPPTKVTGTVIDAITGNPVTNFTVNVGLVWRNADQIYWQNQADWLPVEMQPNGHFAFTPRQPYPGYALRVEAPGYEPSDSQQFDDNAGELSLQFKLQKGVGIGGTVFNSKHQPVPNATVYLALPGRQFQVTTHGAIPEWQQSSSVQTDAKGHYEFAPQPDAFDLICMNDEGISRLDVPSLHPQPIHNNSPAAMIAEPMPTTRPASYDLQIQPWANIDGKMLIGAKPAAHVDMQLQSTTMGWRPDVPMVWFSYDATTDADGNFHFDRVPPVAVQVGRLMKIQNSQTLAENVPVDPKPGQTANVQIGGGREIIGKFALPANLPAGHWFAWGATMRQHYETPPAMQMPLAIRLGSDEAKKKWRAEMVKKPEFKAYLALQKKMMANGGFNGHGLWVKPDGSFHVDNVEPGTYDLTAQFLPNSAMQGGDWNHPLGTANKQITIPAGPSDPPLDIGTIPIAPPK